MNCTQTMRGSLEAVLSAERFSSAAQQLLHPMCYRVWDVRQAKAVRQLDTSAVVTSIEVSEDGRFVTTADGHDVRIWDGVSLQEVKSFKVQSFWKLQHADYLLSTSQPMDACLKHAQCADQAGASLIAVMQCQDEQDICNRWCERRSFVLHPGLSAFKQVHQTCCMHKLTRLCMASRLLCVVCADAIHSGERQLLCGAQALGGGWQRHVGAPVRLRD